LIIWW
jgi:hypothetical protein